MKQLILQYPTTTALVAFWLISNAVSAMPMPDSSSGKVYRWWFAFWHGLVGSIPRALAMKYGIGAVNGNGDQSKPAS